MAPYLSVDQHRQIHDMLKESNCSCTQIARAAECSQAAVRSISRNLRIFGSTKAPCNPGGRRKLITQPMLDALRDFLLDKPSSYLDEMVVFFWDEFNTIVNASTISRALFAMNGILLSRIFQGATDATIFGDFIGELLNLCTGWPGPCSVIIMDNASFHRSPSVEQMCSNAGVKLLYLPLYSPDFNPIEEFFAELKAFVKKNWDVYKQDPDFDFSAYLEWCVNTVGTKDQHTKGHFRHSGIKIEGNC